MTTIDAKVASRAGALGPTPSGPNNDFALEYYKQLVPNSEATLPGSTLAQPAIPKKSHLLIHGRRRISPLSSKSSAVPLSQPILNPELWVIIWSAF